MLCFSAAVIRASFPLLGGVAKFMAASMVVVVTDVEWVLVALL